MNITIATKLQDIQLAPDIQPEVTADCLQLIYQEVSDKSEVSGTAVQGSDVFGSYAVWCGM
jgi:hypothetical protein